MFNDGIAEIVITHKRAIKRLLQRKLELLCVKLQHTGTKQSISFSLFYFFTFSYNSCLRGHLSEMCKSYQLLAIITGSSNEKDIRTKGVGVEGGGWGLHMIKPWL